jgi:hypothetical protein
LVGIEKTYEDGQCTTVEDLKGLGAGAGGDVCDDPRGIDPHFLVGGCCEQADKTREEFCIDD